MKFIHRHEQVEATILQFPRPTNLTFEQRQHWLDVAAYADVEAERYIAMRQEALHVLGMLALTVDADPA